MKLQIAILILTISVGCTSFNPVSKLKPDLPDKEINMRNLLIGEWGITLNSKDGGKREEHAILRKDGTFKFTFKNINSAGVTDEKYSLIGMWGLVENIHFTIVLGKVEKGISYNYDTSDPRNYSAYEVLGLNNSEFKYRSLVNKTEFRLIKLNNQSIRL